MPLCCSDAWTAAEIYTLSLHDALPIYADDLVDRERRCRPAESVEDLRARRARLSRPDAALADGHSIDLPRVRQLDRRRRVHPGHERLRRHGREASAGLSRRPAAREDGD